VSAEILSALDIQELRELCIERELLKLDSSRNPHAATYVKSLLDWKARRNAESTPLPYSLEGVSAETLSALDIQELRKLCIERELFKLDAKSSSSIKLRTGIVR
jgi:hypothetical protein